MRAPTWRDGLLRQSIIETCEDRLLNTAQPLAAPAAALATAAVDDFTGLAAARAMYGLDGAGQTVVIIDSGIAYDHPALGGGIGAGFHVVGGWDFAENEANPYDDGPGGGHGTHIAGILASNDLVSPGIAPGVDLVALRIFDDQANGGFDQIRKALNWVHQHLHAFRNPITTVNLSIGANWNSNEVPSWSKIEDELRVLKEDGLFLSVAAGNDFAANRNVGLSYPAASEYVVPVAAVDSDGALSGFSQRSPRVLAAPGRNIRSTVPDYLGNFNRKTDDFGLLSGTSMATPFVAGASVLVRQALQFVGEVGINQERIESILRRTADAVFDPQTRDSYQRVNVERALTSILSDDIGSTPATATDITNRTDLTATLSTRNDVDCFQFTAAASGVASFRINSPEGARANWTLDPQVTAVHRTADELAFPVVAGGQYSLGLSGDRLAHYQLYWELTAAQQKITREDLGLVDFLSLPRSTVSGERLFSATAARDGWFTVETTGNLPSSRCQIELSNASDASAKTTNFVGRGDIMVHAGDRVTIRLLGSSDYDLRLANLLTPIDNGIRVSGTRGDDAFEFVAGDAPTFTINGVAYKSSSDRAHILFDGGGGHDQTTLVGLPSRDQAIVQPRGATLSGRGYQIQVANVGSIVIFGNGGADAAKFYDSAGDDTFGAGPTIAMLYGAGFYGSTRDFRYVEAFHTLGGRDEAYLYDSAGDDSFGADADNAMIYGDGFYVNAQDFGYVVGAASGGNDVAALSDSAGDDRFVASPDAATMIGGGFKNVAKKFGRVISRASSGRDIALLFDSAGDDLFTAGPASATLSGIHYEETAINFDWVEAHASVGRDRAVFRDSTGDDTFGADSAIAMLYGLGYYNRGEGFEQVDAVSTGGNDVANLYDSPADDLFAAHGDIAKLQRPTTETSAQGFGRVAAMFSSGKDTVDRSATAFALSISGKTRTK